METFGRYLTQQRELRGLSREDVIRQTRLSPIAVEALEEDRFEALPARVFVVGYIRTYALCIGLSPDEAVLRYDELVVPEGTDAAETAPAPFERRRRAIAWTLIAVVLSLLVLAGVVAARHLRSG